jgi:hypothetical protein
MANVKGNHEWEQSPEDLGHEPLSLRFPASDWERVIELHYCYPSSDEVQLAVN